jgi:hypothetical protein
MRRTIKLWEVFVIRFEEALERHRLRRLSPRARAHALQRVDTGVFDACPSSLSPDYSPSLADMVQLLDRQ